jgi:hypothetical protein
MSMVTETFAGGDQGSKLVAGFISMSKPVTLVITVRLVALPDFNKASFGVN